MFSPIPNVSGLRGIKHQTVKLIINIYADAKINNHFEAVRGIIISFTKTFNPSEIGWNSPCHPMICGPCLR